MRSGGGSSAALHDDLDALHPSARVRTELIDALLRDRGWTRSKLAAELGMDRSHVTDVLNGARPSGIDFRWRLCGVFSKFRPAELFSAPPAPAGDVLESDTANAA